MNDIENKQEWIKTVEADPKTAEAAPEMAAEKELKTETPEVESTSVLGDETLPADLAAEQEDIAPESIAPADAEESAAIVELSETLPAESVPDAVPVTGEDSPSEPEHKTPRKKWISLKFGAEPVPLAPFDMHPVTDIIIRRAVDEGVKNSRDLAVYKTTEEWNGYPKDTIILAGLVEEGAPFAIWDPPKRRRKTEKQEEGTSEAEEKE